MVTQLPGDRAWANLVWKSHSGLLRYFGDITMTILLHLFKNMKINIFLIKTY